MRGVSTTGNSFVATDLIPAVPRPMLHSTVDQLGEACTATGKLLQHTTHVQQTYVPRAHQLALTRWHLQYSAS